MQNIVEVVKQSDIAAKSHDVKNANKQFQTMEQTGILFLVCFLYAVPGYVVLGD